MCGNLGTRENFSTTDPPAVAGKILHFVPPCHDPDLQDQI